jgi:hypothetical protein
MKGLLKEGPMFKKLVLISCIFLLISLISADTQQMRYPTTQPPLPQPNNLKMDIDYGRIPLYFIPNEGQVEEKALFYADTSKYTLWVTREGLIFDSIRDLAGATHRYERDVSRVRFIDANPVVQVFPEDNSDHKVSYFRGEDSTRWHTGIETSKAVLYRSLYPHVDLRIYGVEQEIEYDFIVKPGGEVADIGLEYQDVQGTKPGAVTTSLDEEGNLIIQTAFGELTHTRPVAYQIIQGKRIEVEASFKAIKEIAALNQTQTQLQNTYGFEVGPYDKNRDLIIDPLVIVYATYIGGKGGEGSTWVAVDPTGAAYLTCWVSSKDFPTKNAFYPKYGGPPTDACITKLSPDGKSLIYSSYLGGPERDGPIDITVDATGAAYITGRASGGFPQVNSLHEFRGIGDAFIVKVDPTGTSLVYSTYLGGSDFERARGVAADSKGNAYVVGTTWSQDFPTKKAFQKKNAGASDVFLAKLNPTGSAIVFSTYIGGTGEDIGLDIQVDNKGSLYVVGDTWSKEFPTKKAFQKKLKGENDSFLMKFHKRGKKLIYSTYLGGSLAEEARDIDVDMWGNAHVVGSTNSPDFPVSKALYKTLAGDYDIYIAKFKPNGKKLHFSTFMGGSQQDNGHTVRVDTDGTIYIGGYTESKKFPTKDAIMKKYQGEGDSILAQFSADGQSIVFSTFFGGKAWERGYGMDLDHMGGIYLATHTTSKDMPVKNAFKRKMKGSNDMYIVKLKKE